MVEKVFEDEANQVFRAKAAGGFSYDVTIAFCGNQSVKKLKSTAISSDIQRITGNQVHGTDVWDIDENPSSIAPCDALLTTKPQKALTILTADCLPVMIWLFRGEKPPVLGAVHCGWRSLAGGIIDAVFENLLRRCNADSSGGENDIFSKNADNVGVILGPCIGACCYHVKDDFLQAFQPLAKKCDLDINCYLTSQVDDRVSFSLLLFCRDLLIKRGIDVKSITMLDRCTKCRSGYHSHRRNATRERNFSFIFSKLS